MKKLLSVLLLAFLLAGCSQMESGNDEIARKVSKGMVENPRKPVIGFSIAGIEDERWLVDRDIFVSRCKELGADIMIKTANGDEKLQSDQCKDLLSKGIDVLVVIPQNSITAGEIAEEAHKKKVPVVAYDRLMMNCSLDAYISYDNVKIGELQAGYLVKKVPAGNYILLGGSEKDYCSILVREGQMKVLKSYMDRGAVRIAEKLWTRDWNPSNAKENVENALAKHNNNIQAVLASNDATAGGAIQALAEKNLVGKVAVSGQDADLAGCQRIVEGIQSMTVYVPIKAEAEASAEAAVKLAKGQIFKGNTTIDNGKMQVPSLLLNPVTVDSSNIKDTVIKDGFQKMEEVYENIPRSKWPALK